MSLSRQLFSFFISMATLVSAILVSLCICFPISAVAVNRKPPSFAVPCIVRKCCKASRDPSACESSFAGSIQVRRNATVVPKVIQSALHVSSKNVKKAEAMVDKILRASTGNLNRSNAAKTCRDLLGYSGHRIDLTKHAVQAANLKDARAWMTAASVYQYDCWSALKYVNGTAVVDDTMAFLNSTHVIGLSLNVLSMMLNYDVYGEDTERWGPPQTERDGFWEPGLSVPPSPDFTVEVVPGSLEANVTVCKNGGCDYKTVQEAVDAAPEKDGGGKLFVIRIGSGLYEETVRIGLEKRNVVFIGNGTGKTIITDSKNAGQPGMSTFESATVGVLGDGFMARDLTIMNTAGPDAHQAVAFRSDSDRSIMHNCEFVGNQDTLYAHSLRQFYNSCRIQGNVDFIFGNSAAFFQDCHILVAERLLNPEKGEQNAVTAHGRIHPAQTTGFVFQNCVINGTDSYMALFRSNPSVHRSYLGRPWKEYSRTVFIGCTIEILIMPEGWLVWNGGFALKTLYYGELGNTGGGSDRSKRVNWSSLIPAQHAAAFSVERFIQGDQWIHPFS